MHAGRWLPVAAALALASCSPASVEAVAGEFFASCMAEQGVPVENVQVEVRDGRHVERVDWDSDALPDADSIGEDCEEQTLRRFEISRT